LRPFSALLVSVFLVGCNVLTSVADIDPDAATAKKPQKFSFDAYRDQDPQSKLGAVEHPRILAANGGAYSDQKLEILLAAITGKLVAQSNAAGKAFDITILDSPKVNAFALPGGYLYVTRGLLALSNDTAEVAAVLAHEMAHVSSNHGIERSNAAEAVGIADRVVSDVITNPVAGKVAKASTKNRLAAFSQRQELQADAIGIKVIGRAGFDPFSAARFLKSMDRYQAWRSSLNARTEDMSSTHPSTPRRIELAERHARAVGPPGSGERDHERLLEAVDGMLFGDNANEGFIRERRFVHAKLGITFDVPENYELTNRADAVLASGPGERALRFDAVDKTAATDVLAYIKSGWINGLDDDSVVGTTVNGRPAATAMANAGDWQFFIAVVDLGNRYYRFILAAPRTAGDVKGPATEIVSSFRKLTAPELARIKPLRVRVVVADASDTVAGLASRMVGVAKKEALFRALNGLDESDGIRAGEKFKIVAE